VTRCNVGYNGAVRAVMPPEKKSSYQQILAQFCTFLPNRCIEEEFFSAVKIDENMKT